MVLGDNRPCRYRTGVVGTGLGTSCSSTVRCGPPGVRFRIAWAACPEEQNEVADAGEGEELPPSAATGVVEATGTECQTGTEPGQHVDRLQGTQLVGVEAPDGGGDTAEN